jgi:predicted RNA-binding Zn-ribbon protein involved in translation (DUF1610 family)
MASLWFACATTALAQHNTSLTTLTSTEDVRTHKAALRCGCAMSRFLLPATSSPTAEAHAWLHHDDKLVGLEAVTAHTITTGGSRWVQLQRTNSDVRVGILRAGDASPRDGVDLAAAPPPTIQTPFVDGMWLTPRAHKRRPNCSADPIPTHNLAVQGDDVDKIAAYRITNEDDATTTLVDARHVGLFGLGYVEACRHGVPMPAAGATLSITPVDVHGRDGATWQFRVNVDDSIPMRTVVPAGRDDALLSLPFPVPGEPEPAVDKKSLATTVMLGVGMAAALVAFVVFLIIPARRRRMTTFACPQCAAGVPYDALDPHTDGFFCPACGTSGMWRGRAHSLPQKA